MSEGKNDRSLEVRKLDKLTREELRGLGHDGYVTDSKYKVAKEESQERTVIRIELVKLKEPFVVEWPEASDDDLERYQRMISQGFSLGAYEKDKLVGIVIAEAKSWNNSLWIWDIQVSDKHRRKGIASLLLDRLTVLAKDAGFRIIGLEVQNTNVPAISLYRKAGFELDGIDFSYYTNDDLAEDGQVAFFMKKKLV